MAGISNGAIGSLTPGHFHSLAHEIIAIVKGATILAFGGGKGKRVVLDAGDAVLIPPRLLHWQAGAWSGGTEAVGAIPEGVEWGLLREPPPDEPVGGTARVDRPCCDPILGMRSPFGLRRERQISRSAIHRALEGLQD
jgi:uncharacterized protein YjlB